MPRGLIQTIRGKYSFSIHFVATYQSGVTSMFQLHVNKIVAMFQNLEIHPCQRDETIEWLLELNHKFHFSPETFVHSVSLLDRFLMTVKVCWL